MEGFGLGFRGLRAPFSRVWGQFFQKNLYIFGMSLQGSSSKNPSSNLWCHHPPQKKLWTPSARCEPESDWIRLRSCFGWVSSKAQPQPSKVKHSSSRGLEKPKFFGGRVVVICDAKTAKNSKNAKNAENANHFRNAIPWIQSRRLILSQKLGHKKGGRRCSPPGGYNPPPHRRWCRAC